MFTPGYIKHGRLLIRHTEKLLRYRKDLLSEAKISDVKAQIGKLRKALSARDKAAVKAESEQLHTLHMQHMPTPKDAAWRENIEVILVAVVVALGVRSYFLQPFKIPTGSMQPTLNGIIGHKIDPPAPLPNLFQQIGEFVVLGRNYINVVSKEDDEILSVEQKKYFFFFTFTQLSCRHQEFLVYAAPEQLTHDFNVYKNRRLQRGEIIARGAIDTGDQVFVDKFSYNLVKPHRGDVFVFRTDGISRRNTEEGNKNTIPGDPGSGSPFYIKRLAALPGDTLRIDPPLLYVNGRVADGFGFQRMMGAIPPYHGYSDGPLNVRELENQLEQIQRDKEEASKSGNSDRVSQLLGDERRTRERLEFAQGKRALPPGCYFAMGDNSYNSYDSRYWGPVPEENLVGRGLLVYWPFNRHWGLIR
jgi:signal peptidase I